MFTAVSFKTLIRVKYIKSQDNTWLKTRYAQLSFSSSITNHNDQGRKELEINLLVKLLIRTRYLGVGKHARWYSGVADIIISFINN